jgi:hypothetical protein
MNGGNERMGALGEKMKATEDTIEKMKEQYRQQSASTCRRTIITCKSI